MESKKTIVIVVPGLEQGGIERVMLNLATGLQQNNCNVHIVVFKEIIELAYNGNVNIHVFKKNYLWIPRNLRSLVLSPVLDKFIIRHCGKPDLVLSNTLIVGQLLAYSKLNTYLVMHTTMSCLYHYDARNFRSKVLKKIYIKIKKSREKASKKIYIKKPVVCVSKGVQNDFIKLFTPSKKVQMIYNSIDVKFIEEMAQGDNSTNLNDYIVHVGRISYEKRHDVLIKAYKQSNINLPLVLIGGGPLKSNIKALVRKLNLENKVIFFGFQSNPYPFIKNAKLLVLCSNFEGLPMIILEALALNTAVISTNCPSGPSEILPSQNLCPVGNVEKLAQLIKQATNNPLAFIQPLDEKFHLNYAVKKYMDLV